MWVGIALLVFFVATVAAFFIVRPQKRDGLVTDFGRPVLETFLLIGSGLVLASGFLVAIVFFGKNSNLGLEKLAFDMKLLFVGASFLTGACHQLLRRMRREPIEIDPNASNQNPLNDPRKKT